MSYLANLFNSEGVGLPWLFQLFERHPVVDGTHCGGPGDQSLFEKGHPLGEADADDPVVRVVDVDADAHLVGMLGDENHHVRVACTVIHV